MSVVIAKPLADQTVKELKATAGRLNLPGRGKLKTAEALRAAITEYMTEPVTADEAPETAAPQGEATVFTAPDEDGPETNDPDPAHEAPADEAPVDEAPAPEAPAAPAAPVKTPLSRDQKRIIAAALIKAAGQLVQDWPEGVREGLSPEDGAALDGVTPEAAGELIGSWLSYCPGKAWHAALGKRPRG